LKNGLFNEAYHVSITGIVNNDPMSPATNGIDNDMMSFAGLLSLTIIFAFWRI